MSKRIGIVSEGPTDFLAIKSIIDIITGESNYYLHIQPEEDMIGRYGNGWKGVWKWCKETKNLGVTINCIQPKIDVIVIQMDGDVIRKEKEVHCSCNSTICKNKGETFPLYCEKSIIRECPVIIPCKSHGEDIIDMINHGKQILKETLNYEKDIIITIPCDSTDAWIVASYDEVIDVEKIKDPWRSVIAKKKTYHGIRVRADNKNTLTYSELVKNLERNWNLVVDKCLSAKIFNDEVKSLLVNVKQTGTM